MIKIIIESVIGVGCVIGMLNVGIYIGKTFGTFENFVLAFLDKCIKSAIEKDNN